MGLAVNDASDIDPAQAMVWRLSVLTDPPPTDEDVDFPHPDDAAPADLWDVDPGEPHPMAPEAWGSARGPVDADLAARGGTLDVLDDVFDEEPALGEPEPEHRRAPATRGHPAIGDGSAGAERRRS